MIKKLFLIPIFLTLTVFCYSASEGELDAGKAWLGGGYFYNNHSVETFDGVSYYSSDDENFIAPLWRNASGFYADAGFMFESTASGFGLTNSVSYYRADHDGTHTEGVYSGVFNGIMLSAAFTFFKLADSVQPYLMAAMSWDWMSVANGVILSDSTVIKAAYPGLGFHLGAGTFIELFNLLLLDIGAGYRILDYLSGTYNGFSAHFGGNGSGWYIKAGMNLIFYRE